MKKTCSTIISLLVVFAVLALPLCVEAQTIIEVSPMEYDFGDVEVGQSSSMIFTITNTNGHFLTISNVYVEAGSSPDFSVTATPAFPTVIDWGGPWNTTEVEVTFAPTTEDSLTATLVVFSDDFVYPLIWIPLSGTGVDEEVPPGEQIQDILDFIDGAVDEGTLEGDGNGNSANKRLNALINMVEATGDLVADGRIEDACDQLMSVYGKTDGQPNPPDFVQGEAASELAAMILELMDSIGCP